MTKTSITTLPDPHGFSPDPLTDILRAGARDLIQQAVEAELSALLKRILRTALKMAVRGWSGMVICQSARSRPELGPYRA